MGSTPGEFNHYRVAPSRGDEKEEKGLGGDHRASVFVCVYAHVRALTHTHTHTHTRLCVYVRLFRGGAEAFHCLFWGP